MDRECVGPVPAAKMRGMALPRFNPAYRSLREGGMGRDGALAEIRKAGASFIESIQAVKDVDGLSLGECKKVVHESPAWENEFRHRESFWDEAITALEMGLESDPPA
jgi:hypothetical protein